MGSNPTEGTLEREKMRWSDVEYYDNQNPTRQELHDNGDCAGSCKYCGYEEEEG